MRAGDTSTGHVVTVGLDESLLQVARLMREHHVGDVVVVEHDPVGVRPMGIITDRDLVVGVVAQGITDLASVRARDAIARKLDVVTADEHVFRVMQKMAASGVRRMPVVNGLGVLVGILSYDDVLRAVTQQLSYLTERMAHQDEAERVRRAGH